jgi:hypothetical protein
LRVSPGRIGAYRLQPHRIRNFKFSNDPQFAAKVRDIVGPCVDPPAHAVVLSIDERSQIQALDRTQPGLPMKRGRADTTLGVLDGKVVGRCMQRHRHQEFIRFLINRYLAEHNADQKLFRWQGHPDTIIADAARGHQTLFQSISDGGADMGVICGAFGSEPMLE